MTDSLQTMMTASKWPRTRVHGRADQIDDVLRQLEKFRNKEREQKVRSIQESADPLLFVFVYPESPAVSMMMGRSEPGLLLGGMWVPLVTNYQVAESAVATFLTTIFEPLIERVGLKVEFTGGSPVDFYFSGTARDTLDSFVRGKTPFESELRPEDRQRWNAFLIAAQRSGSGVAPEDLEKWLKGCGFPSDLAKELRNQYDFGFQLLEDYEEARNSSW
jgi:hypothetical protein